MKEKGRYTHIYEAENEIKKEREIYRRYALEVNRQVCGSLSSSSFGIDASTTLLELPRIARINFVASPKSSGGFIRRMLGVFFCPYSSSVVPPSILSISKHHRW